MYSLFFYLFFLLENILFKYVSPLELFSPDRYFSRSWNLVPFNDALSYLWKDGLAQGFSELNVYGNILLFIPLGIYLQIFLKKKQVWRAFWQLLASVFSLRFSSWLLESGPQYRRCDTKYNRGLGRDFYFPSDGSCLK